MKEITSIYAHKKYPYVLPILLLFSTIVFSAIGYYWNITYYQNETVFAPDNPPVSVAMQGLHDGLYLKELKDKSVYIADNLNIYYTSVASIFDSVASCDNISILTTDTANATESSFIQQPYAFTTAAEDYFNDACFIGDSRTVGISEYGNIEGATFLCKTSLSIYDYEKKKITYENEKTSIKDVLANRQFSKIYLMLGINECGIGTPESFYKKYSEVVQNIRAMQPSALIFIQGNLLVTQQKSDEGSYITNENISARNKLISTLANQKDIFYIDINESTLCENGSLVPSYTWDQVHIKAQYYEIWKEFLLKHAIII